MNVRADTISIPDLKAQLQKNIQHLVSTYCPGGYVDGDLYWARNPARADRHIGSFNIRVRGSATNADQIGMFFDFAAPEYRGDILDFFSVFVCGGMPGAKQRGEAIRAAKDYLGIPLTQRLAPVLPTGTNSYRRRVDTDLAEKQKRARERWIHQARTLTPGDPVWTYLTKTRRIPIDQFDHPPGALRFMPDVRHTETDTRWPAMISAGLNAKGRIMAIHTTFLTPDGEKAPVEPVKKMWPSFKGLTIPISKGKTGLTTGAARKQGLIEDRVVFTEGIEDALCWRLLYPDDRVHAVGSISNFGNAPIYHCADEIIIVRDRFKTGDDKKTFENVIEKLTGRINQAVKIRGYGPRRTVHNTEPHDDINDLWISSLGDGDA